MFSFCVWLLNIKIFRPTKLWFTFMFQIYMRKRSGSVRKKCFDGNPANSVASSLALKLALSAISCSIGHRFHAAFLHFSSNNYSLEFIHFWSRSVFCFPSYRFLVLDFSSPGVWTSEPSSPHTNTNRHINTQVCPSLQRTNSSLATAVL